ncbi:MAG: tryptophan--tRNA ligase, partial [Firmicutes bacterium]|nr:tryptophan--tRNA ligase [Bacillota bacterium]
RPEVCVPYQFYKAFTPELKDQVAVECRNAAIGCVDCKQRLANIIVERMAPLYERRQKLAQRPDDVMDILRDGARKARLTAEITLAEVRQAMNMRDF